MKQKISLIILTLLISCETIDSGVVIEKHYEASERNLVLIPMRIGKTTIMQQYWIYDDEDWVITVEGVVDNKKTQKKVYVSQECYKSLSIRDTWHKTSTCSFTDNNNTKTKK